MHFIQLVEPFDGATVPAGQSEHVEAPFEEAIFPASHASQSLWPVPEKVPASHKEQLTAPPLLNVPPLQAEQDMLPSSLA